MTVIVFSRLTSRYGSSIIIVMDEKIYQYIMEEHLLQYGDSVILGVSGGADSICMLYVLARLKEQLGIRLHVVHINHMIRKTDAHKDCLAVKQQCHKLHVPFYEETVNVPKMAKDMRMSEEEAGRKARYDIFEQYREQLGANKIAVAHQLDDQSETVLFHLFRGTGIRGLIGMSPDRGVIIRPLLCVSRSEIEKYLEEHHIGYCQDFTNYLTQYSRNRIRLELIPYLKKNINEKAEYNIINAANNLRDIYDYLCVETDKAYAKYVTDSQLQNEAVTLHRAVLSGVIRKMIECHTGQLRNITKQHIDSIIRLFDTGVSAGIDLPYKLRAVRTYGGIRLSHRQETTALPQAGQTVMEGGRFQQNQYLHITMESDAFSRKNISDQMYTKWFDYDKIKTLELRNRKSGDYLQIDAFGHTKTMKEYMIHEKIPREKRGRLLLLADGNHVVWVIGYRISEYYKVTETTQKIIRVDYTGDEIQ